MELKKFITVFFAFALVFSSVLHVYAEQSGVISLGRIDVVMPEISVEIKGSGYDKNTVSATLGTEKLTVEDAFPYDAAENSSCAYILVDLSTSMRTPFRLVKQSIVSYINTLNDNDQVVLITFGETEVDTVLNGSETREEAIRVVNGLKCDENGTLFYEALSRAYQLSNSSDRDFDREYVIAFSDGIDYQKGNTTFEEVKELYDSHALPLYAACTQNTSKDASDKFGELARVSGGSFSMVKDEKSFDEFLLEINDVTLLKLKASSNFADGQEKLLSLKIASSQVEYSVPVVRSVSDTVAPQVADLIYDGEKDVFVISYSEKVDGAASSNAYKITGSNGKKLEIAEVFYSEADNAYEIKTKDPVTNDTYTFEFSGIRDASQEANSLSGKQTLKVTGIAEVVEEKEENEKTEFPFWALILILVAGLGIVVVIVLAVAVSFRKKDRDEDATADVLTVPVKKSVVSNEYAEPMQDVVKHHIKTNEAIRIRLNIRTGKTSEQNIETGIVSSLIIGRSDTCDIYIDDTKLSRQHFVIENDNGTFYVMDLQSRNGTMLNGIRINSRQRLSSGDKIVAGLSDIVITILGR